MKSFHLMIILVVFLFASCNGGNNENKEPGEETDTIETETNTGENSTEELEEETEELRNKAEDLEGEADELLNEI